MIFAFFANRAKPVSRQILKFCSGSYTLCCIAYCRIIYIITSSFNAFPFLVTLIVVLLLLGRLRNCAFSYLDFS